MSYENPAFDDIELTKYKNITNANKNPANGTEYLEHIPNKVKSEKIITKSDKDRDVWGKDIEFLLSCIASSVGLGNVWRFPFTALDNGGGAFLIPYLIVLFLVGKPFYYIEMIVGQFSSRGFPKAFDFCPALRGVGVGQVIVTSIITSYYVAIMAITLKYFSSSFESTLPWSVCKSEWTIGKNITCLPSFGSNSINANDTLLVTSAELYYTNEVLHESNDIEYGIGLPDWQLTIGLFISWLLITIITIKGVKSSGKFSYFLAIFPYVVFAILLVRGITLPGSTDGMLYFITPQWEKLLYPKVWYAAVTQVFYSLSVCMGNIIMYSSYNKFNHNIYRDVTIVSLLDTFTSLLAGLTIFGVLGHLAYALDSKDIGKVVKAGPGLAFVSYPEAIAKFEWMPQIFSVLFFVMLFILGIGSVISCTSCTMTSIRDYFPHLKKWICVSSISLIGFCIGLIYLTPGGQAMLTLIDNYGVQLVMFLLGFIEIIGLNWIYGMSNICEDVKMMLGSKPGFYWRICWSLITPIIMLLILVYNFAVYEEVKYNDDNYPVWAYGWAIFACIISQLPIWMIYAVYQETGVKAVFEKITKSFMPNSKWGPSSSLNSLEYQKRIEADRNDLFFKKNVCNRIRRFYFD